MHAIRNRFTLGLVLVMALGLAGEALGEGHPATANLIEVTATSGSFSATFEEVFPVGSFDTYSWALPAPIVLQAQGETLATIEELSVSYDADPQVDLNFNVTNNNLLAPMQFSITTALIVFTPVPDAQAAASASVTFSQGAGSPMGGYINGLFPEDSIYQARYSTDAIIDSGDIFANLCPSMTVLGLGASQSDYEPAVPYADLNTTVYMMQAGFHFELSPGDQASGTSNFLIVPEPATALVLALGGLGALMRRRR